MSKRSLGTLRYLVSLCGSRHGPVRVFDLVNPDSGSDIYQYRYEDQLGSITGMADDVGTKLLDYTYLDYGRPIERGIAFDGDHDDVDEVHTSHSTPNTTIAITGASFTTDEFKGMQLAVMDASDGSVNLGTVQSNTSIAIVVDDVEQNILDGIKTDDLDFVIYDFVDTNVATSGSYHTAGEWTSNVSYNGVSDLSTLTDSGGDFKNHMAGWMISPRAEDFGYLEIVGVDELGTYIQVKGDVRGLARRGDRYWVIAPPHIEKEHGTIDPDALRYSSKHLWAGYEYITPMAGFYVDPDGEAPLGVYGRQTGSNQAGWYYAWNRIYDIYTGRWTSPDPAASPWSNLQDYVGGNPISRSDPSGLFDFDIDDDECTITMNIYIQFDFEDGDTLTWTSEKMKEDWALKALQQILDVWDDKFLLKGKAGYWDSQFYVEWCDAGWRDVWVPCPCPEGYRTKLDITYSIGGADPRDDTEIEVTRRTKAEEAARGAKGIAMGHAIRSGSDIWVSSLTENEHTHTNGIKQKLIAHEFGHILGFKEVGEDSGNGGDYDDPKTG